MKYKYILAFCFLAMGLAGCSNEPSKKAGGEYIGKWEIMGTRTRAHTMEIERNGESFLIRITEGGVQAASIPATLKDGVLQASGGFGTMSMAIDKASGNLTAGQDQYKRVN